MKKYLFLILLIFIFVGCKISRKKNSNRSNLYSNNSIVETISVHNFHELQFGKLHSESEHYWDSLNGTVHISKRLKKNKSNTKYRTFGWHLYTHGTAYKNYNFPLLWGIAYFAYIIDSENGSYKNIHQWKTTELIDSAKVHDCNVFLTVANFGKENNARFLNSQKSQETLIDSVIHLLSLRKANGINLDFESVSVKDKTKFTEFIIKISQSLKKENPEYMVTICLYAVDYHNIFNIKALNPYIDFYTLMGYDYYGSFSDFAGPVAPLKKSKIFGENCLESSVDSYINKGVEPSKLIVGLPGYGAEWIINNTVIVSKSEKFNSHLPYKTIKKIYIDSLNIPILFDSISKSSYCNIPLNEKQFRQLWFDDVQSLSFKFDWIKNKQLGGAGIWALGFDNEQQEIWSLISEKFGQE